MLFHLLSATIFATLALAKFNPDSRSNVAVYWGQNQGTEKNLTEYCASSNIDIVLLSFLNAFPGNDGVPTLTLDATQYSSGYQHELTDLARQVKACQKNGKIVMLSLGGEGGDYGFESDDQAKTFAMTLWQMFGDGNSTAQVRPFGDVKIDGFDLDIETNSTTGFEAMATELRRLMDDNSSKSYYLSAAPQCPYPEKALGGTLNNTFLDFAFIQFYNNKLNCDANTDYFNWNQWSTYAQDVSKNKNIKLFMGIPGSESSAASGYFSDKTQLQSKIELASANATFGGIMLWDVSTADNNTNIDGQSYIKVVRKVLKKSLASKYYANGTYESAKSGAGRLVSSSLAIGLFASIALLF